MIFAIDIDGVLCSHSIRHYDDCVPDTQAIRFVNELYDTGHDIHIYSARGAQSKANWLDHTLDQLECWKVKYDKISLNKPHADVFIDDKSFKSVADYLKNRTNGLTVATSGYFDPLHVGHIELFRRSREYGDKLIVILGNDEALKRKKGFVFMPLQDRFEILISLEYVDSVVVSIDTDGTCNKTLRLLKPDVYTKGGGSLGSKEADTCAEINCKLITGVAEKIRSSTELVKGARRDNHPNTV